MGKFDDEDDGKDTFLNRDKDPERRVFGRAGVNRAEKLKERETFFEDRPTATQKEFDEDTFSDNDIIRLDETFAEGIPQPRVQGFSGRMVDTKVTGTTPDGKFNTTTEPVNVDQSIANMESGTSGLSEELEDRRVERTLQKERGQGETFGETFTRKFGAKFLDKSPAGKELKVSGFSQGVLSRENAKKFAKDGFMGNIFSPTQFTVGEKGKKEHVTRKKINVFDVDMFNKPKKSKKKSNDFDFMGGF